MLDPVVLVFSSIGFVVVETERTLFLALDACDFHVQPTSLMMYVMGGWVVSGYKCGVYNCIWRSYLLIYS